MIISNRPPSASRSEIPPWLFALLERFEAAWQQGRRPKVEALLPTTADQRQVALVPLLGCDLERRLRRGQPLRVEDYLRRFPELANDNAGLCELVAMEYDQLRQRADVTLLDYVERFPQCADWLRQRFGADQATIGHATTASQATADPITGDAPPTGVLPPLRYRPMQFHAQGALGEVLLAQDQELNREVALKRIQEQYADDPASRRRFLREAEVTGRLEHPGVIPVYGVGQDSAGRPCYAMRFIQGESLKEAIERFHAAEKAERDPGERSLALRQLLGSFVTVCKTMAYAHSRGVLHRDLKPANIMLGTYGETLVVDWGLARAFQRDETPSLPGDTSLPPGLDGGGEQTPAGAVVGTPAYCSPEQATGQWDQVGPASDIFSLGAVLYNLLTNQLPYRASGVLEILDHASRGLVIAPRLRKKDIPGPLEAICLKAMARQADERYLSALDLAADVEHWLADEPVEAYREPGLVRAGRWMRKHRPLVAGLATAAAVALVSLTVVLVVVAGKNRELANRAEAERLAKEEAEKRLVQIEKGTDILASIFADLDPHAEEKERKPLREILGKRVEAAVAQLEGESIADALTVAKLQNILATSLMGLGRFAAAVALFEKAAATRAAELGEEHRDTLGSRNDLGVAYYLAGRLDLAVPLLERTLATREATLGDDHPDTLANRNNLALVYREAGHLDLAIPLLERTMKIEAAKLGEDSISAQTSRNNLAMAYNAAGQWDRAIPLMQRIFQAHEAQLGPDHLYTLQSRNNLARAYADAGKLDLAIPLFERSLQGAVANLGDEHPQTLKFRNNLAAAYYEIGQVDRAIPLLERTLQVRETHLGDNHQDTLNSRNNLANVYQAAGKLDLAIALYERTVKARRAKLGDNHPDTLKSINNLGLAYQEAGQLDRALPLFQESLKGSEAKLGADHPETLVSRNNLANAYRHVGQLDRALPLFDKVIPAARKKLGFTHPLTLRFTEVWIATLEAAHHYSRAIKEQQELMLELRKTFGNTDLRLAAALGQLGNTFLAANQAADAEPVLRESLAIRDKKEPEAWTTFYSQSLLGVALAAEKKYADAELLLLHGYQGMKQRQAKIRAKDKARLTQALERLVQLYEAIGKKDEAAKWRKELDTAQAANKPMKRG
jgi:tRNA A-37 threonylcarbamoyl transferase component Bud32/lipopolysaccharide biosynthesis regulator YciM